MKPPIYSTPLEFVCPFCGEFSTIIPLQNEFSYSGTHCTGGRSEVHYPSDWGIPICSICEEPIQEAKVC